MGEGRVAAYRNARVAWAHPEDNLRLAQQRDDTLHGWAALFTALDLVDHHVSGVPLLLWQSLLHPVGHPPHGGSTGLVHRMVARLERNHRRSGQGHRVLRPCNQVRGGENTGRSRKSSSENENPVSVPHEVHSGNGSFVGSNAAEDLAPSSDDVFKRLHQAFLDGSDALLTC